MEFNFERTDELTAAENQMISEYCEELARKHNVSRVHAVVVIDDETKERIMCFLKEPSYAIKLRIMDKSVMTGIFSAADELREAVTLKEESDPRTYGDSQECDRYKMGITDYCLQLVERTKNQFKKK